MKTPEQIAISAYVKDFQEALKYFGTYSMMKEYYLGRQKYFEQGLANFESQCEHNVVFNDHTQDLAINNTIVSEAMDNFIATLKKEYNIAITDFILRIKALEILINEYEKS